MKEMENGKLNGEFPMDKQKKRKSIIIKKLVRRFATNWKTLEKFHFVKEMKFFNELVKFKFLDKIARK